MEPLIASLTSPAAPADDEPQLLEAYVVANRDVQAFPGAAELLQALLANRVCSAPWRASAAEQDVLRVLQALRLLVRDAGMRAALTDTPEPAASIAPIGELFGKYTQQSFAGGSDFGLEILTELASIVKRLCTSAAAVPELLRCGVHQSCAQLLESLEATLVQSALLSLIHLALANLNQGEVSALHLAPALVQLLRDCAMPIRRPATELLILLLHDSPRVARDMRAADGVPTLLSVLQSEGSSDEWMGLMHLMDGMSQQDAAGFARDVSTVGGVPVLMSMLGRATSSGHLGQLHALCGLFAAVAVDEDCAFQIGRTNGVWALAKQLIRAAAAPDAQDSVDLAAAALRALRALFGCLRLRRQVNRLIGTLPSVAAHFLEMAVGPSSRSKRGDAANPWASVAGVFFKAMAEEEARALMTAAVEELDCGSDGARVRRTISTEGGTFEVLELLGRGAFGSVHRVRHRDTDAFYAMKQLPLESESSGPSVRREVEILSQLQHPNIVRYYNSYESQDAGGGGGQEGGPRLEENQLFIMMEYVEGQSLNDRLAKAAESNAPLPERDIWHTFVQMAMAILYMHTEKRVAHRDLSPSNVLLDTEGAGDVKLADFGLSRQLDSSVGKRSSSSSGGGGGQGTPLVNQSVVGTVRYACPEILQSKPSSEKADIWSLGCILYHMATLHPPFAAPSLLTVVRKIVELDVDFDALAGGGRYTPMVRTVVEALLVVDPDERPSIQGVIEMISPLLVKELESATTSHRALARAARLGESSRQRRAMMGAATAAAGQRLATAKATAPLGAEQPKGKLSISAAYLRPISDPSAELLAQMQKLMLVGSLAPAIDQIESERRRLLSKYQGQLAKCSVSQLKSELHKLAASSSESVGFDLGIVRSEEPQTVPTRLQVSYAQLRTILDGLLVNLD